MPPARTSRVKAGIDLPALLKMQEPLTIAVSRVRQNQKEPIMLDPREGQHVSNVGWTKDEVQAIDQEIIEVSGGGVYEVQVTDAQGNSTAWTFMVPTEIYPMKPPRTNPASAYAYGAPPSPPAPGLAGFSSVPGYPASYAPPAGYPGYPGYPATYGASTPIGGWGVPGAPATPRPEPSAALAAVQQQQQMAAELHRRDLLDERHRHEREMAELKRQIEASKQPVGLDDRVERERAAREAAERDAAAARAAVERVEREAAARAERIEADRRAEERARQIEAQIIADRRQADERFQQMMAQMTQLAQALSARPAGPDPMMMLLIENQKATAEAAREAARIAAETEREKARVKAETDKEVARARAEEARINSDSQNRLIERVHTMMAPNQMSPMDAARVVKEASQSADQFTKTMVGSMNDMMDIQRNFLANMMQMAPQGEGVAGRIVSAIENVAQTVTQSQAQVAAAQAHAAASATRPTWQPPPPVHVPETSGPNGAGIGGVAAPTVEPQPVVQPIVDTPSAGAPAPTPADGPLRNGKTDAQWFGPALSDVLKLREGVTKYLVEVSKEEVTIDQPKKGEHPTVVGEDGKAIGVSPQLCAQVIVTSAAMIMQNNIPGVEAFDYFWKQQMYPALVDVMIPDAPAEYRIDVLRFLNRLFTGEALFKDTDAPMYGIAKYLEDGEEVDEPVAGADGALPPPPARQPVSVATGRRPR